MSDLVQKIIRQIEYYFGDINLNKDKFMKDEIQKDAGWVDLETLTKFNRLKALSSDPVEIITALKQSTNDLLEIDEENKKVRRTKPLPENLDEFDITVKQNTVYVKGFPETLSLDELISYFEGHGKVLQVFMRRFPSTKKFKGSVFVTFDSNEEVKKFLELDEVKYHEEVLVRESQEAYVARKGPELEKHKSAKLSKEQQKEELKKQKLEAEEAFLKEQKVLNAILHLKGLNSEGTRENIKELFDTYAKVRFIDYNKGNPEAFVRFAEENSATEALAKALEASGESKEITLKEAKLECRVLQGEEEDEYWTNLIRKLAESRANKHGNNKNTNRRRRNDNGGYSKREDRHNGDRRGGDKNNGEYKNRNKRSLDDANGGDQDQGGGDATAAAAVAPENNDSKKVKVEITAE
jgi:lupus La protein